MEKFSTWRDKGTGISPFIPADIPAKPLKKYIVNPVLLLVKWPFFLVLYALSAVAPKPALQLAFTWLFGIEIDLSVDGVRRTKTEEINRNRPRAGDVVVANCVSPLDVLVLFLTSASPLAAIVAVVPQGNELYAFTAWQCVSLWFDGIDAAKRGRIVTPADISGWSDKLVVVFAEGTPSNNRAVLPLSSGVEKVFATGSPVKTAVLRYYPAAVALPVPTVGKGQYVSRLLTLGKIHVKVKVVPMQKTTLQACKTAFAENGLSSVQLGLSDKSAFWKYYQDYALENITKNK